MGPTYKTTSLHATVLYFALRQKYVDHAETLFLQDLEKIKIVLPHVEFYFPIFFKSRDFRHLP